QAAVQKRSIEREAPPRFSRAGIGIFSVVFSPVTGGLMLRHNWNLLDDARTRTVDFYVALGMPVIVLVYVILLSLLAQIGIVNELFLAISPLPLWVILMLPLDRWYRQFDRAWKSQYGTSASGGCLYGGLGIQTFLFVAGGVIYTQVINGIVKAV